MQPNVVNDVDAARTLAALFLRDANRFDDAAKGLARANHSVDVPITSNSMGANLPKGTLVCVALTDATSCNVGDIVVFRQADQIVVHRVIHSARAHLITRGDARLAPDPPVTYARVLGRVTGIVEGGGVAPLKATLERHVLVRTANAIVRWMTVAALQLSPALSARLSAILTFLERRSA